jgi:hypothetical protein
MKVKIPAVTIPAQVIEVCDFCEKPQSRPLQCCRVCGKKYCGCCHGFPIFFCKDCFDREDVKDVMAKYERKSSKLFSDRDFELQQLGKIRQISEQAEKKRKRAK